MGTKKTRKRKKIEIIETDSGFTSADVSETKEYVEISKPYYKQDKFKEEKNYYKNEVSKEDEEENNKLNVSIQIEKASNANGCAFLFFFLISWVCYTTALFTFSGGIFIIGIICTCIAYFFKP